VIARIELEALAKSYGLTNATRFVNLFQLSGIYKDTRESFGTENVQFRDFGPGATVEIPIFDLGEVRVRQAEQTYMLALNRLAEKAVNVRSQAREAYRTYRSTYDIASHYQREILPLRKIISDETLLRYNGMLVDVFTLLAEARQRILSTVAAIQAKRDSGLPRPTYRLRSSGEVGRARWTKDLKPRPSQILALMAKRQTAPETGHDISKRLIGGDRARKRKRGEWPRASGKHSRGGVHQDKHDAAAFVSIERP